MRLRTLCTQVNLIHRSVQPPCFLSPSSPLPSQPRPRTAPHTAGCPTVSGISSDSIFGQPSLNDVYMGRKHPSHAPFFLLPLTSLFSLPTDAWETASNWASGSVPSGTVNLNQPCMSFGGESRSPHPPAQAHRFTFARSKNIRFFGRKLGRGVCVCVPGGRAGKWTPVGCPM